MLDRQNKELKNNIDKIKELKQQIKNTNKNRKLLNKIKNKLYKIVKYKILKNHRYNNKKMLVIKQITRVNMHRKNNLKINKRNLKFQQNMLKKFNLLK